MIRCNKESLPKWYGAEIYINSLSLDQWIIELDYRRQFYMYISSDIIKNNVNMEFDSLAVDTPKIQDLFEVMVSQTGSNKHQEYDEKIVYPVFESNTEFSNDYKYTLVPSKPIDLDPLLASLQSYVPNPIESIEIDESHIRMEEREGQCFTSFPVTGRTDCLDVISVNTEHYSDATLMEYFKQYLEHRRKAQREKGNSQEFFKKYPAKPNTLMFHSKLSLRGGRGQTPYTQKDFDKWHKFKLLAVIDFILWGQISSIKYTDYYLAELLMVDCLPEGSSKDRENKVKVVRGWAYELFASFGIEQLRGIKKLNQ